MCLRKKLIVAEGILRQSLAQANKNLDNLCWTAGDFGRLKPALDRSQECALYLLYSAGRFREAVQAQSSAEIGSGRKTCALTMEFGN